MRSRDDDLRAASCSPLPEKPLFEVVVTAASGQLLLDIEFRAKK